MFCFLEFFVFLLLLSIFVSFLQTVVCMRECVCFIVEWHNNLCSSFLPQYTPHFLFVACVCALISSDNILLLLAVSKKMHCMLFCIIWPYLVEQIRNQEEKKINLSHVEQWSNKDLSFSVLCLSAGARFTLFFVFVHCLFISRKRTK